MVGLSSQMQISGVLNGECINASLLNDECNNDYNNAIPINSNQENFGTD